MPGPFPWVCREDLFHRDVDSTDKLQILGNVLATCKFPRNFGHQSCLQTSPGCLQVEVPAVQGDPHAIEASGLGSPSFHPLSSEQPRREERSKGSLQGRRLLSIR